MTNHNQNAGFIDRLVRGLLAIDLLAACLVSLIDGPSVFLFVGLAAYFTYSGLTGHCPIYTALGRDTRQRTEP